MIATEIKLWKENLFWLTMFCQSAVAVRLVGVIVTLNRSSQQTYNGLV